MVYLDHIAATPIDPRVLEAMTPYLSETFGSPLSLHRYGKAPRQAVEHARSQVATLIGADPDEIVFTAGGTEADNLAIKGLAHARERQGRHIIVSSIEHHAVLYPAKTLARQGFTVTHLPVDRDGLVDPDDVARAIREDTILISVMSASDEIGTIQPIRAICAIAHERDVPLHTDAVCTVGAIPVDIRVLGVDALSMSAQPMSGPKGVGALYIRRGARIRPLIEGGIQEGGRRGGHENVPAIVGFGTAAELTRVEMPDRMTRLIALRDRLIRGLFDRIGHVRLNGHPTHRTPGHVSVSIRDADSESMVLMLDAQGIAVSMGSSCSSHASKPSHVLTAIGLTPREAQSSLLLTLNHTTMNEDIEYTLDIFPDVVKRLRSVAGIEYERND